MVVPTQARAAKPRLRLYNAEWCWYCQRVREKLGQLGLAYELIEVPVRHSLRKEVLEVSGQTSVPVLVDGDMVLDDDDVIIPYLERTYGSGADDQA
jgi:glutaredoxin 3